MPDFEIVFSTAVVLWIACIGGGWVGSQGRLHLSLGHRQQCCACRNSHDGQERPRVVGSSLALHSLISAPQWH